MSNEITIFCRQTYMDIYTNLTPFRRKNIFSITFIYRWVEYSSSWTLYKRFSLDMTRLLVFDLYRKNLTQTANSALSDAFVDYSHAPLRGKWFVEAHERNEGRKVSCNQTRRVWWKELPKVKSISHHVGTEIRCLLERLLGNNHWLFVAMDFPGGKRDERI